MPRAIDDAGEKIGGARKDWRQQRMSLADIDAMTEVEALRLVTKDRAFPTPDWHALIEQGAEPRAVACLKVMRDAMGGRPNPRKVDVKKAAELYLEECQFIADLFDQVRTEADVQGLIGKIVERHNWSDKTRRSDPMVIQAMWGVLRGTSRSHPLSYTHKVIKAAQVLIDSGWPDEVPAWLRGVRIIEYSSNKFLIKKGASILGPHFDSQDAAKRYLQQEYELSQAKKQASAPIESPREPQRPYLTELERVRLSSPQTPERAISPDLFLETFGFRGVEFGEWLPDDERQLVLNHGYWALIDLADVLKIPPGAVGLNGTLAVAFGARGQGGMAAAHYEPSRKVLNLTRVRGAGTLAHEYGHALDNWIGGLASGRETEGDNAMYASGGRSDATVFMREKVLTAVPEIGRQMSALMTSIYRTPLTETELHEAREARISALRSSLARQEAEVKQLRERAAAVGKYRAGAKHLRDAERQAMGIQTAIDALSQSMGLGRQRARTSDFISEARRLCGKSGEYWLRPTELFARSFECWVFDKLSRDGEKSDYLVHSVEEDRYADHTVYKGNPYPVGDERTRISNSLERLIETVRPFICGPSLAPAPDASSRSAIAAFEPR